MKRNDKQKGFTIIELVVVILLLGILTATALPRFMDVTDEAHAAVVDGVVAGLQTSTALARASWMARGQPTTLNDYAGIKVNTTGYVIGASTVSIKTNADCVNIFDTLLQVGRPTIAEAAATGALVAANITPSLATRDFVAKKTAQTCYYAYTGQFKDAATADVPVLIYSAVDGSVTRGTAL